LVRYANWIVECNAEPDICAFYIDCRFFLETQVKKKFPLSLETAYTLGNYFDKLCRDYDVSSSQMISLQSRWSQLMNQRKDLAKPEKISKATQEKEEVKKDGPPDFKETS
jgi:hypothetical protein